MKKWGDYVILCLNPGDSVIRSSANAWKARYKVPDTHCFAWGAAPQGYQSLDEDVLSQRVNSQTKLMIFAHANESRVNGLSAPTLALWLLYWGVKQVGLIAFKACEVGKGDYLETLFANRGPMNIGWLIGYKPSTSTMGKYLLFGEAREVTFTVSDIFWHFLLTKAADKDRVKIVQGDLHVSVQGTGSRPYITSHAKQV